MNLLEQRTAALEEGMREQLKLTRSLTKTLQIVHNESVACNLLLAREVNRLINMVGVLTLTK